MRVLVAVVPLSGHVGPVSGLVAEMVARGHDVRVYTGERQRKRFDSIGARTVPWTLPATSTRRTWRLRSRGRPGRECG